MLVFDSPILTLGILAFPVLIIILIISHPKDERVVKVQTSSLISEKDIAEINKLREEVIMIQKEFSKIEEAPVIKSKL